MQSSWKPFQKDKKSYEVSAFVPRWCHLAWNCQQLLSGWAFCRYYSTLIRQFQCSNPSRSVSERAGPSVAIERS